MTNPERTLAQQPAKELSLEMVVEMTGYELTQIALVRHQMAGSMNLKPDQVPLRDIAMYLHASKALGLDPLLRQVHWISRGGKGTLQVGVDGFRAIAERSGVYAGSEPPTFRGTIEQTYWDDGTDKTLIVPEYAQVVVWKIVAGHKCAFTGEARWVEFYPGQKEGFMYRKMPRHMLAKDAEAQALRKAFPALLGSVQYVSDSALDSEQASAARERSWQTGQPGPPVVIEQPARTRPTAADYDRIQRDFDGPSEYVAVNPKGQHVVRATGEVLDADPGDKPDEEEHPSVAKRAQLSDLLREAKKRGLQGDPPLGHSIDEDPLDVALAYWAQRIENHDLDQQATRSSQKAAS